MNVLSYFANKNGPFHMGYWSYAIRSTLISEYTEFYFIFIKYEMQEILWLLWVWNKCVPLMIISVFLSCYKQNCFYNEFISLYFKKWHYFQSSENSFSNLWTRLKEFDWIYDKIVHEMNFILCAITKCNPINWKCATKQIVLFLFGTRNPLL